MKLLATVLPRIRRLMPTAERGLIAALVVFVAAIEFAGYYATSEFHDALAGSAVAGVFLFVMSCHRSRPIGWIESLQNRLSDRIRRLEQLKYDVGIDFRGDPPLPRRLPRSIVLTLFGLSVSVCLAFTAWHFYPNGWRELGLKTSYLVYVTLLTGLWLALVAGIIAGVLLPTSLLDARLRSASGETNPAPPDAVVVVGYVLLAILVACVAPPVYSFAFSGTVLVAGFLICLFSPRDSAAVLWRCRHSNTIFAVPMRRILGLGLMLASLFLISLIAWACGGTLFAAPAFDNMMPVTGFLGSLCAWLTPGLAAVLALQWIEYRRGDPARVTPPLVHLDGADSAGLAAVRKWGFEPVAGLSRKPVGLRLVSESESEATEFNPEWPLKVSRSDLQGTLVRERVERRDELQVRRQFFKAMAAIVKEAKAAAPTRGGGFLIAPHYWFITSILWADPDHGPEADEDSLRAVGPKFRKALPVRARQYMRRVLRATQIDAIYLEDGLGHRKLEKVLRAALELYDIHGGRRCAEDHHFQGIPKVRVVIHDYRPGNPFEMESYPEPKFDDVSRSRVLHIFKDRGDEVENTETPFDFSWEPAPMALV